MTVDWNGNGFISAGVIFLAPQYLNVEWALSKEGIWKFTLTMRGGCLLISAD